MLRKEYAFSNSATSIQYYLRCSHPCAREALKVVAAGPKTLPACRAGQRMTGMNDMTRLLDQASLPP